LWWQEENWKALEDSFSSGKFLKVAPKRGKIANLLREQICLWISTSLHNDELPLKASLNGCNISHPNACTVSVHYRCAHGTPNFIHTLVKVWAKILSPNPTPTHIVSSVWRQQINSWPLYTRDWKLMTIKKKRILWLEQNAIHGLWSLKFTLHKDETPKGRRISSWVRKGQLAL
jgi:hypothetical protein